MKAPCAHCGNLVAVERLTYLVPDIEADPKAAKVGQQIAVCDRCLPKRARWLAAAEKRRRVA